jgi:alcohol dehydrogenase, propanol-preferring
VKAKLPLTPGHEGAGIVEAVGSEVTNLKVGDRVGIPWLHSACGTCEYCVSGWETLCTHQQNTGYSVDGCLREYTIAQASHAVKLPDNLSFEQAAPILCAGVTSYKGIKEAELRPGQFIGIVGAGGGLGHLAIQYAKAMGLRPIAYDVGMNKAHYCREMGAEHFIDATSSHALQETMDYTQGGVHGSLCIATSPQAFSLSTDICRRKGCVVCCGLPPGGFPTPIFDIVLKRVTIRGSIVGTREDLREALDFAARGQVQCTVQTKKLSEINDIFSKLKKNQIEGRMVIKFDD